VFEDQLSECRGEVVISAAVKSKAVFRLLQQFAGQEAAEEPSPLGNVLSLFFRRNVKLIEWQWI